LLLAGCMLHACAPQEDTPPPADRFPQPPTLTDTNAEPAIVEVSLIAQEGTHTFIPVGSAAVWGYRDGALADSEVTVPGPTVRARVGDELIIHLTNNLTAPTTIHYHGMRVPNAMDGSTSTQRAVQPGETFTYQFRVRDAGTFWYHPHVESDVQVERGLHGAVVIEESDPPAFHQERVLLLDDVKLTPEGVLDPDTDVVDIMSGRQGNILLVNGQRLPTMVVQPGAVERWRIINVANGRYFQLSMHGAQLTVIAWDGGRIPQSYAVDSLLIAPGERYDLAVTMPADPATLQLLTAAHAHGTSTEHEDPRPLLDVLAAGRAASTLPIPMDGPAVDLLVVDALATVRPMVLSSEMDAMYPPRFFINGERWPFNRMVMVRSGDVEAWEVRNDEDMDHPFHIHGLFFQVSAVNGQAPERRGWKDTVNIPAHSSVRLAVPYGTPGMWMFHCTILEHAERGMMGDLMIE